MVPADQLPQRHSGSLVTVDVTFLNESPVNLTQTKFGGFFAGTDPLAFSLAVIPPFDPVDHTTPPLQTASTVAAGFASNRVPFMAAVFGFFFASSDRSRTFNQNCHL
jgi:hypothetical protein